MSVRLLIAPSSAGKTEYVLRSARALAGANLRTSARQPILVVPTPIQARSARARLAALGGAIGLRIFTFDELYRWILVRSAVDAVEPPEAARFRLMRSLLERLAAEGALPHYQGIAHTPGLATLMLRLVEELQNARVLPASLLDFWSGAPEHPLPAPDRLLDIAVLYDAWERLLVQHGFSDRAGMGVLALDALASSSFAIDGARLAFFVDGFDFLTELQLQLVVALADTPGADLTITLTGDADAAPPLASSNRFDATRLRLEAALQVRAQPLPPSASSPATVPILQEIRRRLNRQEYGGAPILDSDAAITLLEASQRATEVRAALRWLKRALVQSDARPQDCALLVRDATAWRATVLQVAAEFGLPVRLVGGLPLEENPVIVALLALLKLTLPDTSGSPAFARDDLVALMRSPYVDLAPLGLQPGDAERLDAFARSALLAGGITRWRAAFAGMLAAAPDKAGAPPEILLEEQADESSVALYSRADVERLAAFFERLAARLTPPESASMRQQIAWLEGLLDDHDAAEGGLGYITALRRGGEAERARDENALLAFKELLRSLLFSAEQLGSPPLSYADFLEELGGALDGVHYDLPAPDDAIFCATIVEARGLPFSHVALLGLVEGELPKRTQDDPFLREEDRLALRGRFPGVQSATESQEREYFVEAISRAENSLLLTRPVIGENGSAAEPSPYWLEVRRWLANEPASERSGALADAALAASMPELLQTLAQHRHAAAEGWVSFHHAAAQRAVESAGRIFALRTQRERSVHEGDLRSEPALIDAHFPSGREWSPTAFESWLTCPYYFLTSRHLHLEPPAVPEAQVDRATLGSIYHRILQALYTPGAYAASALERLDTVADAILASAPESFRFLNTAIWQQQSAELRANLRKSVAALDALGGLPIAVEQYYRDASALHVATEDGDFRIRGVVDRIDALPDGSLRLIDYKTGKSSYDSWQGLAQGKRLQLPLYALMVENALGEDKVSDGIYFFVHTAEAARWSLAGYPDGIDAATGTALNWARRAVQGMRAGNYVPEPPAEGCPEYCPAIAFCWQYKPGGFR